MEAFRAISSALLIHSNALLRSNPKTAIILSSRVHPGETVGSWMMKGTIDFLTGQSEEAKMIRDRYLIIVLPMLNPDGVVQGNYRTSLAGCDLNRKYAKPLSVT